MIFTDYVKKSEEMMAAIVKIRRDAGRWKSVSIENESRLLGNYLKKVKRNRKALDEQLCLSYLAASNEIRRGYFPNLEVMRLAVDCLQRPDSLIEAACLFGLHDDICAYAIERIDSQDSLQRIFVRYGSLSPLNVNTDQFTPVPRGTTCLSALLFKIDDDHLLAGLRELGQAPAWARPESLERFKYQMIPTGKRHIKFNEYFHHYYQPRLEKITTAGLITPEEMARYT